MSRHLFLIFNSFVDCPMACHRHAIPLTPHQRNCSEAQCGVGKGTAGTLRVLKARHGSITSEIPALHGWHIGRNHPCHSPASPPRRPVACRWHALDTPALSIPTLRFLRSRQPHTALPAVTAAPHCASCGRQPHTALLRSLQPHTALLRSLQPHTALPAVACEGLIG